MKLSNIGNILEYILVENPYMAKYKMELSQDIDVSNEFRFDYNMWLKQFFGKSYMYYIVDRPDRPYIVGHPEAIRALKQTMREK